MEGNVIEWEYVVVEGYMKYVTERVSELLNKGWVAQGGICTHEVEGFDQEVYSQAMTIRRG